MTNLIEEAESLAKDLLGVSISGNPATETDKKAYRIIKALVERLKSAEGVVEAADLVSVETSLRNKHLVEVRILGVENLIKTLAKYKGDNDEQV